MRTAASRTKRLRRVEGAVFFQTSHPILGRVLNNPENYATILENLPRVRTPAGTVIREVRFVDYGEGDDAAAAPEAFVNEAVAYFPESQLEPILKAIMLAHLAQRTYVQLGVSSTGAGVGVFALRDIPAGAYVFRTPAGICGDVEKSVSVGEEDLRRARVPREVRESLKHHFVSGDGDYPIPVLGPSSIDMSYYLNHSDTNANMEITRVPGCEYFQYRTARPIAKGEELFLNYRDFGFPAAVLAKYMPFLAGGSSSSAPQQQRSRTRKMKN